MTSVSMVFAVLWFLALPASAQRPATPLREAEGVAEFERRITAYVALRDKLNTGAAELDETRKPAEIVAAEKALAAKIQSARSSARQGDVFTPAVQERFRRLLNPEMKGVRGRNTRGTIWDEGPGPGAFELKVNSPYPKEQPLGSVPPNVLKALPPLPDGIEYRFVYRNLVLRDTRSNLIIDYMPAAIPVGER